MVCGKSWKLNNISISDADATDLLLSKDALNAKKARTFCTYLKEKKYADVNVEYWTPEMLPLPCHS